MIPGLFAGLDVSTQSCKLVVIDPERGEVVHVDAVNYDADLPHYETSLGAARAAEEGVSESDPAMWIEAVEVVLERMRPPHGPVNPAEIRCVSVSGQQHGLVALAADGSLAHPRAKLWNDYSTGEECRFLTEAVGGVDRMLEEVGNTQRTGYTAPKILRLLRHHPEAYARSAVLFVVHNYVNWWLTGGPDGGVAVMEPGDASGLALWHAGRAEWSRAVLDAVDPGLADRLPPIRRADATIGPVGGHLVERFGFDPECRVDAGSGDNMYAAVGTGNVRPGTVTISLGTSGTACSVTESAWVDPTGEIASYADSTGRYLPLLCVSNMANGYADVRERFGLDHEEFAEHVARTPVGNGGRLLVPWFTGERTPDLPDAAPLWFGFGTDDFRPEHLCRAAVEGHVLGLWSGFRRWPVRAERVHLTGGLARSEAWVRAIADIFDVETVPVEGEGAALGAALHAAWVWSRESGSPVELEALTDAFVTFAEERRMRPSAGTRAVVEAQKALYTALTDRIRGREGADPFTLRKALLEAAP